VHHWKRHKDPTSYMIHVITYMGEKNQLEPGSMISSDPLKPSSEQKRDIRGSNMLLEHSLNSPTMKAYTL